MAGQNVSGILKLLDKGRIAVVPGCRGRENMLALELESQVSAFVRLTLPGAEEFVNFLRGALSILTKKAGHQARFRGVVMIDFAPGAQADYTHPSSSDMLTAVMELMERITSLRVVLVCQRDQLIAPLASAAARVGIPALFRMKDDGNRTRQIVEETAARCGIRFENAVASKQTVTLCAELMDSSPAFRLETLLRSVSDGRMISESSIGAKSRDQHSYLRMCLSLARNQPRERTAKKQAPVERIGFLTLAEREQLGEKIVHITHKTGGERHVA